MATFEPSPPVFLAPWQKMKKTVFFRLVFAPVCDGPMMDFSGLKNAKIGFSRKKAIFFEKILLVIRCL